MAKRAWRRIGRRMAWPMSTGASSTCRTSGASMATGPPRLPDRNPNPPARAARIPSPTGQVVEQPADL